MLSYLGYDREDKFISDIKGRLPNSIHPGDRKKAIADAKFQLDDGDEYTLEYRMRKKTVFIYDCTMWHTRL